MSPYEFRVCVQLIITYCNSLIFIFSDALAAVVFQQSGRYLNPSRASPLNAYSVHTSTDDSRSVMYAGKSVAVLVSSVLLDSSHLVTVPDRGLVQHYISGIFHNQEWERFCAFMCMVFGHPELTAQVSLDALSFSTKTEENCKFACTTRNPY